jgi:hypothetical protein
MNSSVILKHLLSTIQFRFKYATQQSGEDFGDFEAGSGVLSPKALVNHITHLMSFVRIYVDDRDVVFSDIPRLEMLNWEDEISRFDLELEKLKTKFELPTEDEELLKRLIQGPLSDALTHVGQIALLRRLYGNPVERISFFQAVIQ